MVDIEGLCNDSNVFSKFYIERFLMCIDRLFEVFREDLQRSIVIRRGFENKYSLYTVRYVCMSL